MSGFLRLLLATVMAVLGWLALPAIAVSASASTHVETYIYDAPAYDGPGSDAASERGPPTEVRYTTHDAVVRWSHGASVRPHDASRLTFTSDAYLSKLVQAGEPTTTTGRQVVTLDGDLLASGRSVSAAKSADDWPVISGVVRDASRSKGNFGLGSGTASQATRAGESWVGDGYRIASDGKSLVSRDGLRVFRPPSWKSNLGKYQANFEYWVEGQVTRKPIGNGHFDVTDMVP
ncbi:hypothetical protein KV100_12685 [Mumia sp. zg.B21]|uniref:hypothetical protein n=1 Tax=Mumia sp. zg.B21 TaxID=2855447 RepID=UPI001C6E7CAF|nr:hypothetical protein [Mumia sp. zg.B21]MBW9210510.1 hypothetical protein [Mumia sp. zg.B21]